MGMYDRQWYREAPARRAPSLFPVTKYLLIANVAAFVLSWIVKDAFRWDPIYGGLGLSPYDVVQRFHVWQLVTSMFLHVGLFHILFNMIVLWMFGGQMERELGPRRFLRFYFYSGLSASLAYVVIGQLVAPNEYAYAVGASGAIFGVMVWFAFRHPNVTIYLFFVLRMKIKWAVSLLIAMDLYGFLSGRGAFGQNIAHTAHLGGALFGFLDRRFADRYGAFFSSLEAKKSKAVKRHEDGRDRKTQAEVDRLLEKIHEGGIDSLSQSERDFLREASRKYRKDGS